MFEVAEISFVGDLEGATTGLEGLRAYDSNEDGVFDAQDERWGEFKIWRDINQNGQSSRRELQSLEEAGITSINLTLQSTGNELEHFANNAILNTADYTRADGTSGTTYDVALASSVIREGRESGRVVTGRYEEGDLNDRLGRISTRRLERLLARGERRAQNDSTTVVPIVFDLNRNGELEINHLSGSGVEIDVNNDGELDRLGWVGATDGLLGLDRNGDGLITAVSEISFVEDLEGARTDLEGLAAFDSNGNGLLDAGDARFSEFRIWQDANQDGVSEASELRTLGEAGLTSINLTAHTERLTSDEDDYLENVVFGHTAVRWDDGSESIAGDVGLRVRYTGLYEEGEDSPQYITGFAGLEHVRLESASRFEQIVTQSAWGQIAGRRSPLMAMLLEAEAEQARLESLGTDLGMTQDELLAEFESDQDDVSSDVSSSQESDSAEGALDTSGTDSETVEPLDNNGDEGNGRVIDEPVDVGGSILFASDLRSDMDDMTRNHKGSLADVRSRLRDLWRVETPRGAVALPVIRQDDAEISQTDTISVETLSALDQFTQAMVSFGTDAGYDSFRTPIEGNEKEASLAVGYRRVFSKDSLFV